MCLFIKEPVSRYRIITKVYANGRPPVARIDIESCFCNFHWLLKRAKIQILIEAK